MNKAILSLFSCSGSIAAVLATSTVASTDAAKTIPYPEVMNLSRVPTFDAQGIVLPKDVASQKSPARRYPRTPSITKILPEPMPQQPPITVELVSSTVREAVVNKYLGGCTGCRNLAPTVMVLGYSSDAAPTSYPRTMMY
jgi:hypothetical protein